jgi:hypothetical protein
MRDADPQPLAAPTAPVAARHVGGSPCLVDEDQPLGIEIELILEPLFATRQDIGAILLEGVRGLFLRVILWRLRKRRIVPSPKTRPCAASWRRNSSSVMSVVSSSIARIVAPWASIRPERLSHLSAYLRSFTGVEPTAEDLDSFEPKHRPRAKDGYRDHSFAQLPPPRVSSGAVALGHDPRIGTTAAADAELLPDIG